MQYAMRPEHDLEDPMSSNNNYKARIPLL